MSGLITYEDRLKDELQDFRASMKLAVKALKFYANRGNYIEFNAPREVLIDNGLRARNALEKIKERVGENNEEIN
jgi:hypothetical protein